MARFPNAAMPSSLEGDWSGDLVLPAGQSLPLVVHIQGGEPDWTASVDSPAQDAFGMAVSSIVRSGTAVSLRLAAPAASYNATLSRDGSTLKGEWSQGDSSFPLTLERRAAESADPPARPQTPLPPFPYEVEEVSYENAAGCSRIAGTLTKPFGDGPFPAALLISGSGLQDRDETLFGHKPFLVWADALTRKGIAVLRTDDRQIGGSRGDVSAATTIDFAGDVRAGVAYLKRRSDIDGRRIGLIGHSEGGIIAPIVAADDPAIAYIVLLAAPGMPGEDIILEQKRLIETAAGASDEVVDASVALMRRLYQAVREGTDQASAERHLVAAWRSIAAEEGEVPDLNIPPEIMAAAAPWIRWFLGHDPERVLNRVRCPVLAIGGSKDMQVPAKTNLCRIEAALRFNTDVTIRELPGLNHLFQEAETGNISEYAQISETVSRAALDLVMDWIGVRGGR